MLLIVKKSQSDLLAQVPLLPPPIGEKFEGGYHIERNPITGAARLVHPPETGEQVEERQEQTEAGAGLGAKRNPLYSCRQQGEGSP